MMKQMLIIMQLRSRMFRNNLLRSKSKRFGSVVAIIMQVLVVCLALFFGLGAIVVGNQIGGSILKSGNYELLTLLMDAVLFYLLLFWMINVMMELQRDESIDFQRLLYLPIKLCTVYILNFGMSLFSIGFPFYVLGLFGFCIGLSMEIGASMLLGIPLGLLLYVMIAAWSYFLQGLFVFLLKTKRQRQIAMMLISFVFSLPGIGIYVVASSSSDFIDSISGTVSPEDIGEMTFADEEQKVVYELSVSHRESAYGDALLEEGKFYLYSANALVPLGWFPLSMAALASGGWIEVWLCFAGLVAWVALGLMYGYRSTLRHYAGGGTRAGPVPGSAAKRTGKKTFAQWVMGVELPLVSETTSAVACSHFLVLLRHPMIWNVIIMPVILAIFFMLPTRSILNSMEGLPSIFSGNTLPYTVVVVPFFSGVMLYMVGFGLDVGILRAYILLPGERSRYLLGHGMAISTIIGGLSLGLLLVMWVFLAIPFGVVVATFFQILYFSIILSMTGNLIGIYFPCRIAKNGKALGAGQMAVNMLMSLMLMMVLVLLCVPTMIHIALDAYLSSFTHYGGPSAGILISLVCAVMAVLVYARSLPALGRLLEKREKKILSSLSEQKA